MKENGLTPRGKYTLGVRIHMLPEFITTCPKCGGEMGLWSEEQETICIFCDHKVFEREKTTH
jgi:DNA-directed RNA polymerase subunit RPC12/RpoP